MVKLLKVTTSVLKQKEFLILLTLYEDKYDYQTTGITVDNLVFNLIENKGLWFKVGKVSDNKWFEKSLSGDLSRLDKKLHYLRRSDLGKYFKGRYFEEGFRKLVADLFIYLEIDIEFGERIWEIDEKRADIVADIGNGNISFSHLNSNHDKKINMLTSEQLTRLVQLAIEFDCYE